MRINRVILLLFIFPCCKQQIFTLKEKCKLTSIVSIELIGFNKKKYNLDEGKKKLFLTTLGSVKISKGIWEFYDKAQLVLIDKTGRTDTLITNGEIFVYRNYYFIADSNIVKSIYGVSISR